jgi:hypothetical protein
LLIVLSIIDTHLFSGHWEQLDAPPIKIISKMYPGRIASQWFPFFRARSAVREISVYQSNMFVSAGFAVAVAVGL